ncbi:MAG: arginase family protein [Thermoleophilaceae bacterium]|nr:arginase family protein [Thermoleophilaceae bacterium]
MYWWGLPTLFRCPVDPDPNNCDIALVGVPHSSGNGSTERDQHLGPRAIRDVSVGYRKTHRRFQLNPWEACRVNDLGDVPLPYAMVNDPSIQDIEAYFKQIDAAGARPVSVGGDHSIPLPILRAIAGPNARVGQQVALVHFDAHTDTYDQLPTWLGAVDSAGHWASKILSEGLVDASHSLQIGMRGQGWGNPDPLDYSRELGYQVIDKDEFDELGIDGTVAAIRQRVGDLPVYISFDLDVLDPSVAPGVSNLEYGEAGFTMKEALRTLQGMRGLNVIGADLVCLMPTKDNPNKITAWNGTTVLFEQICLIADYLVQTRR